MALREEVALDISAALGQVAALERALGAAGQGFNTALTNALAGVSGVEIEVTADTSTIAAQVEDAVTTEVQVPISGDFSGFDQALAQFESTLPARVDGQALADQMFGPALAGIEDLRREVASAPIEVAIDTTDAVVGMDRATQATDAYSEQVDNAEGSVGRLVGRLRLLAAVAAVALGTMLVNTGVQYNTLVQQASAAFETMLGSADEAQALLADLAQFASTSPFPRQAFIEATQQMLAFGFAADEVIPTLDSIQQAIAATGGSAADLQEIVSIFSQIRSTGRITSEDLNQLGTRGINAAELIAQAFGQTEAQIRESITRGTIDADEAIAALTEQMGERFEGATDRVRDTFLGTMDRIRGAIRDIASLLVSGFVDPSGGGAAVEFGNELADQLRGLQAAIGPLVSTFNGELLPVFVELAGTLLPLLFDVIEAGLPIIAGLGAGSAVLAQTLQLIATVISVVPPELLALASTAFVMSRAINAAGLAITALATRARAAGAAMSTAHPAMLAITVAATALSFVIGRGSEATSQFEQDVASLARQLDSTTPTVEAFVEALNVETEENSGIRRTLLALGLTTEQFLEAARAGQDFESALLGVVRASGDYNDETAGIVASELDSRLRDQIDLFEAAAAAQLELGVTTGQWTEKQAAAAVASAILSGSHTVQIDALTELRDAYIAAAAAEERAAEAGRAAGQAYADQSAALASVADGYPALARAIRTVSNETTTTNRDLLSFALAADQAELSADQLESVAGLLGVTTDELSGFIRQATGALDEFANAATSRLPTTGSIFSDLSRTTSDARGVPETMKRARESTERFTRSLVDARAALEEALRPASAVDLERAEIGIENAQNQQAAAAEKVLEAEEALARVRWDAANQGVDAARLQAERERELREAQLGVREAALAQIDAETRLREVQEQGTAADDRVVEARERVGDATRDLADAQVDAADQQAEAARRSDGAARQTIVTAAMFTAALRTEAGRLREFRENLATITDAGFSDLAATIAREGPEVGNALADELATSLRAGNRRIAEDMADALSLFEQEWSLTTEFFRSRLGPEMILEASLIGTGISDAFGSELDFAERIRIAAELAESGLTLEGQALATIAATQGEAAARDYARLLDLEGPTVDEAIAAGRALVENAPVAAAGVAGVDVGHSFADGVAKGMDERAQKVGLAAGQLAEALMVGSKTRLRIESPSKAAADEIAAPFIDGLVGGLDAGHAAVVGAVDGLTAAMLDYTGGGISATVRAPQSGPAAAILSGETGGSTGAAPLVGGDLVIYATDAASGMRAALTDLSALQRRTR